MELIGFIQFREREVSQLTEVHVVAGFVAGTDVTKVIRIGPSNSVSLLNLLILGHVNLK